MQLKQWFKGAEFTDKEKVNEAMATSRRHINYAQQVLDKIDEGI